MAEEFGPYVLEGIIGRGGMGVVYRAFDSRRDRTVALKRLPRHLAEDTTFQARFRRESRMAARLNEPHIIPIHDFGEIDGQLYLDMRLVEGYDLSSLIIADTGPLMPDVAVDVVGQVASALTAAHQAGLVHRDVKPSNVLVTGITDDDLSNAFAYLVDFGIARAMLGGDGTALTSTTGTVGTLAYMAPERISGASGDNRSDIYSLACVLYECLTGHAPFAGEAFQMMFAHVNSEPPVASATQGRVSSGLDAVIRRGMAKDPADRYQTVSEFATAARRALAGPSGTGAARPTPLAPPPPTSQPVDRTPPPPTSQPVDRTPPPPTSQPVDRTPPPRTSQPFSDPVFSSPHSTPPPTTPPPTTTTPAPHTPLPPRATPPPSTPLPPRATPPPASPPPPSGRPVIPASPSPGGGRPFTGSGPIPIKPPQQPQRTGGASNRAMITIAIAAVVVLIAGVSIIVAVRGGSSDPQPTPGPTSTVPSTPDFPGGSKASASGTSTSTNVPTGGWAPYADFTQLIGDSPGDTSTAFLGATCALAPPSSTVKGMVDQVECTKLKGTPVVVYVGRFGAAADVTAYINNLVKDKYKKQYWTIAQKRRGLLLTSPATAKAADVTSSICELPTFLVQFYATDSTKVSVTKVQDTYWAKAIFPNATPAICT